MATMEELYPAERIKQLRSLYAGKMVGGMVQHTLANKAKILISNSPAIEQVMQGVFAMMRYSLLEVRDVLKRSSLYAKNNKRIINNAFEVYERKEKNLYNSYNTYHIGYAYQHEDEKAWYKGGITDKQIFEIWMDKGTNCWDKVRPQYMKLRTALEKRISSYDVKNPVELSWVIAISQLYSEATLEYEGNVSNMFWNTFVIPKDESHKMYHIFDLQKEWEVWVSMGSDVFPDFAEVCSRLKEDRIIDRMTVKLRKMIREMYFNTSRMYRAYEDNEHLLADGALKDIKKHFSDLRKVYKTIEDAQKEED